MKFSVKWEIEYYEHDIKLYCVIPGKCQGSLDCTIDNLNYIFKYSD